MSRDPAIVRRKRAEAARRLASAENRLEKAVLEAIGQWLASTRRNVLAATVTAAADWQDAAALMAAAGPPNMDGFSASELDWLRLLRQLVFPTIEELFGEAWLAVARTATIAAQPYREQMIETVESRLKLFPAIAFEEIRFEIAEAISEGEDLNQIRSRVEAFLDFDTTAGAAGEQAETRDVQGRIDAIERVLDDPAHEYAPGEEARLRRERSQLYSRLHRLRRAWVWKAQRIARTEAALALNGGTYYAAVAVAEKFGEQRWKEWISTKDVRTRPTHVVANGQIRQLTDSFTVGGAPLLFPADPAGPGHETIQCRCSLLILDEDELAAMGVDPSNLPDGQPQPEPDAVEAAGLPDHDFAQGGSMTAPTIALEETRPLALPDGWRGVIAPIGVPTGDERVLDMPEGGVRMRQVPMPIQWQEKSGMGHDGAVVVGRIDRVWADRGMLWGEGPLDLGSDNGREVARLLGEGFFNGISMDPDQILFEERWYSRDHRPIADDELADADYEELWQTGARPYLVMADWRLSAATLVAIGAFDEARVEPVFGYAPHPDANLPSWITASLIGDAGLPVGPRNSSWDGDAAAGRIFDLFTDDDGTVSTSDVARAFLWRDNDADPQTKGAYKLPFADVVNGKLQIMPSAVAALAGGHGVTQVKGISEDARDSLKAKVCSLYAKVRKEYDDWPDCPFDRDEMEAAALVASGGQFPGGFTVQGRTLPAAAFTDPGFTRATALQVDDDGRVRGHLCLWETCHLGFPDACVTPPRSRTGYAYFHVGEAQTDEGPLPVGKITLGTGHAGPKLAAAPAAAHYDDTGTAVAVVRAGEDDHGIWVAGMLLDDVDEAKVAELRRSPLSGDWRRIVGGLELVAALCVNVPGFPVPRTIAASGAAGGMWSLVAAGAVPQPRPRPGGERRMDYPRLAQLIAAELRQAHRREEHAERLARRIGRDTRTRVERAAALVHPETVDR